MKSNNLDDEGDHNASPDILSGPERAQMRREELGRIESELSVIAQACRVAVSRFETLFQSLPVPAVGFDAEGTIYEINPAASKFFCAPEFAFLHQTLQSFASPVDEALVRRMIRAVFRGKTLQQVPWLLTIPNGEIKPTFVKAIPLPGADGQVSGGLIILTDPSSEIFEAVNDRSKLAA